MVGAFVYSNMFVIIYFMFFWKNDSMKCFSRSDPTENDSVEGLRPNARGPGLVTFGVSDFYLVFCKMVIILFFFLEKKDGKKKVSLEEASEFLRIIQQSEFKVIEQLNKNPARVSLLESLMSSASECFERGPRGPM